MAEDTAPTSERLEKYVQCLKEWLAKTPHLPNINDEPWLANFLFHGNFDLDKTKLKLDSYFSVRTKYPEIFKNRDPTSAEIYKASVAYNESFAPRLTSRGEHVMFVRPHSDVTIFDVMLHLKRAFMLMDTLYLEDCRYSSIITVSDFRNLSYRHFIRGFSGIKPFGEIFTKAYTERTKAFHMVNTPAYFQTILKAFRLVLPEEIMGRIIIHDSVESLKQYVDEDILCSDFGGNGPPLAEYDEYTRSLLEKHQEWFLEQEKVCSDEKLRTKDGSRKKGLRYSLSKLVGDGLQA